MKIGKYAFDSQSQADSKIEALGVETDENGLTNPTHEHFIVVLGNIILEHPTYENGAEVTPIRVSEKWHVDVLWDLSDSYDAEGNLVLVDHPHGWKTYSVNLTEEDEEGTHAFSGLSYHDFKFTA